MTQPTKLMVEITSQIVLQLPDRALFDRLLHPTPVPKGAIVAMQQLVELVSKLRSVEHGWHSNQPPTPETLVPYVSEEAYTVLDALDQATSTPVHDDSKPVTIFLEQLMPKLLWCVACSSYPTMQLIEGIRACASLPDQPATPGVLRLAVLLQIQTPEQTVCLDLATVQAAQPGLDPHLLIQTEDEGFLEHLTPPRIAPSPLDPSDRWAHYLHNLTQQLGLTVPTLTSWLQGISVELLCPGDSWQTGTVRLKLEFEFMPHLTSGATAEATCSHPVEAELLDELEAARVEASGLSDRASLMPIAVVEMPTQPLIAATIVRLADDLLLKQFANLATERELLKAVHSLPMAQSGEKNQSTELQASDPVVLALVQAAYRISELTYESASASFGLLQPELFTDELIPKLLWHITRSSYAGMQWVGGMPVALLQPQATWTEGTLRLVMRLELKTEAEQWFTDLATGRSVADWNGRVDAQAIVHCQSVLACSEPLRIQHLQAEIVQTMQTAAAEIALLMGGVAIEWLTPTHDWQPGTLRLHADFEFVPNLF